MGRNSPPVCVTVPEPRPACATPSRFVWYATPSAGRHDGPCGRQAGPAHAAGVPPPVTAGDERGADRPLRAPGRARLGHRPGRPAPAPAAVPPPAGAVSAADLLRTAAPGGGRLWPADPLRARGPAANRLRSGGRPGARLAERLRVGTSRMTLLRLVRAAPDPPTSTAADGAAPRVVGGAPGCPGGDPRGGPRGGVPPPPRGPGGGPPPGPKPPPPASTDAA